ncbi:Protein Dom3Z [Cyphomyrmex costatus]|uniref:Decapping nuclease n=1 Tax=Cyphomyrmex costatus TaxID=456900 RepID=A0A195CLE8_9HYME|nr:Protein Dom3Z [Cyphomyrmex costatus]
MSFKIDLKNFSEEMIPTLTAELIGHFSIDGDMQYHADLSQLKYYIPPSDPNNVDFDLNKNFIHTHYRPTLYVKLDNILKWISNNFHRLEKPLSVQEERWLDIDFIASRGAIKAMLSSPYKMRDELIICASKYRGTIYLCEFYSDKREYDYVNLSLSRRQVHSWGYKFEQYMVADHPSGTPDLKRSLNECEQFFCMFKANFDNHSLLYAAEIDGISSQQLITDTLEGKTFELIELKTYPLPNEEGNIHGKISSLRVMEWWSQSYLVHLNKIICGLKDKNVVRMIKEYSINDLSKLSEDLRIYYCYCHVGRLSHEVGWKYKDVVRTLENKRRVRAILEVQKRNKLKKLTKQAGEAVAKATAPYTAIINNFGYN